MGQNDPVIQVGSNTLPAGASPALAQLLLSIPNAGSGSARYSDPSQPDVYLGSFGTTTRPGGNKPLPGGGRLPSREPSTTTLPLDQAKQFIYGLDPAKIKDMAEQAWFWGYPGVTAPDDVMGFIHLWQDAVDEAAAFQAQGKNMTPMDVLEFGATANAKIRAQRAVAGGFQTQKSRQIDLTDATSATALVRQAFKTAVGRNPTDAEIRTLTSSLIAAEKANPRVSVQQASFDANGNQIGATTTTNSGGIDPSTFVQGQVDDSPEAKEFQAAATYFPALAQALGAAYGL